MENVLKYDDKDLCRLIAESDKDAFTQLFTKYSPSIYSFLLQVTKSVAIADENLQEIFMRVWYNREKFADLEQPGAYVNRIAAAVCYVSLKQILTEEKVITNVQQEFSYHDNKVLEVARYYTLAADVRNALKKLTPPQKIVYSLSREKGLKVPEIAEQLSMSPNEVRTLLNSSVESMDDYLQSNGHSVY